MISQTQTEQCSNCAKLNHVRPADKNCSEMTLMLWACLYKWWYVKPYHAAPCGAYEPKEKPKNLLK